MDVNEHGRQSNFIHRYKQSKILLYMCILFLNTKKMYVNSLTAALHFCHSNALKISITHSLPLNDNETAHTVQLSCTSDHLCRFDVI